MSKQQEREYVLHFFSRNAIDQPLAEWVKNFTKTKKSIHDTLTLMFVTVSTLSTFFYVPTKSKRVALCLRVNPVRTHLQRFSFLFLSNFKKFSWTLTFTLPKSQSPRTCNEGPWRRERKKTAHTQD